VLSRSPPQIQSSGAPSSGKRPEQAPALRPRRDARDQPWTLKRLDGPYPVGNALGSQLVGPGFAGRSNHLAVARTQGANCRLYGRL
jgi:hypothetical protein